MSKKVNEIKGLKRGYKATIKNKKYNFGDGKHIYEVIELAGPKMDKPRIFVDEESVRLFIERNEGIVGIGELMDIDLAKHIDADMRDSKAKRPEDTDK